MRKAYQLKQPAYISVLIAVVIVFNMLVVVCAERIRFLELLPESFRHVKIEICLTAVPERYNENTILVL